MWMIDVLIIILPAHSCNFYVDEISCEGPI
jgi:hypothetical protein